MHMVANGLFGQFELIQDLFLQTFPLSWSSIKVNHFVHKTEESRNQLFQVATYENFA